MPELDQITVIAHKSRPLTPGEAMIQFLSQYIGLKEIPGEEDNPVIVEWFHDIGFTWINDDETPYCSCTVNYVAKQLKIERSGALDARSWLKVGQKTTSPIPGDIVVFWRESPSSWKGHVGIFLGFSADGRHVWVLGGNQGNEVGIRSYPVNTNTFGLLDFRRLSYETNH
ncbi:TIGR02594 family protein [Lentimicrobium sp.]|uniref:TIGR02594 family protein n=1 Tax=Lentimicrobium sp. TaxID=2034841 RepID=UPI00345E81C6